MDREASMTYLDSGLSVAILAALAASMTLGWWWADAVAAIAVAVMAGVQGAESWHESRPPKQHTSLITARDHGAAPRTAAEVVRHYWAAFEAARRRKKGPSALYEPGPDTGLCT